MNKNELISRVAQATGQSKKDVEQIVLASLDAITAALQAGEKVSLVGFGSFSVRERAARNGINPLTKKPMEFAACKIPSFKAGKAHKEAVK